MSTATKPLLEIVGPGRYGSRDRLSDNRDSEHGFASVGGRTVVGHRARKVGMATVGAVMTLVLLIAATGWAPVTIELMSRVHH